MKNQLRILTNKEYDQLVELTNGDDTKMHWQNMFCWVNDEGHEKRIPSFAHLARGYYSKRSRYYGSSRYVSVGFRPTLGILESDATFSDIQEGATAVMGTLYLNGRPVRMPEKPTCDGDIKYFVPGAKLEMREPLEDPAYQVVGIRVGNALIADRCLLHSVSYEDIEKSIIGAPHHQGNH